MNGFENTYPAYGEAKDVEVVVVRKVLHLSRSLTRRAISAPAITLRLTL